MGAILGGGKPEKMGEIEFSEKSQRSVRKKFPIPTPSAIFRAGGLQASFPEPNEGILEDFGPDARENDNGCANMGSTVAFGVWDGEMAAKSSLVGPPQTQSVPGAGRPQSRTV